MIFQVGAFVPPLPDPELANAVQLIVALVQVADALTVWASAAVTPTTSAVATLSMHASDNSVAKRVLWFIRL